MSSYPQCFSTRGKPCPPQRKPACNDDFCLKAKNCIDGKVLQNWVKGSQIISTGLDTRSKSLVIDIKPSNVEGQVLTTVKENGQLKAKWQDDKGGVKDHAQLENLDFPSSGHTGFVPSTLTINGKSLDQDIVINAEDISGVQKELTAGANITITPDGVISASSTITSDTYVHDQTTPANTWTIQHNLNKYPSCTIVDSAGTVVQGEIQYPDKNTTIIKFQGGFSGQAYLN